MMKNVISKQTRHGRRRRTLAGSLALWLSVIVMVIIALLGVIYFFINVNQAESDLSQQAKRRVEELANVLSIPTWNLDKDAINQIVVAYQVVENVAAIRVLDDTGSTLYESVNNEEGLIIETRPILFNGKKVGAVELSMSTEQIAKLRRNILIQVVAILAVVILTILVATWLLLQNFLGAPLAVLTQGIEGFASGDYSLRLKPLAQHELNIISDQFNAMAEQIQIREQVLEQRVADRTKALATSTEVSRRLSTIVNEKELVTEVVGQVNTAFGYYHTQIYFYDETKENLVMAGGTGEAGEKMLAQFHKIAKGRGLVGRAAESNETVLVSDTSQDPDWLPNPLLPDTKAEIAIPISIGHQVLGVLDVQQNTTGGLKDEDADLLESLANQVAVALQNARSFTQIEVQRRQNELILDTAAEGIFGLDVRGNHTYVNPAAAEMLGYSIEELIGRHSHSLWHHTHADGSPFPAEECPIYATLHDGKVHQGEEYFIRKDGVGIFVTFASNPFFEEGRVVGAVVTFTDITQRKQEQEAIAQIARREASLNLITQKIQSTTSVESALQMAARELGHALGTQTSVQLKPTDGHEDSKSLASVGESTK